MASRTKRKKESIKGWFMSGLGPNEYLASLDTSNFHSGSRCAHLYPGDNLNSDESWATLMQQMRGAEYIGKRLRMSLWVKTKDVTGWVAPWMRVDGIEGRSSPLSFDNFCTRQIKSTTDWTKYDIVLDVPAGSVNIAFGVMLGGRGDVWIDEFSFEIVSKDVPVTDCPCSSYFRESEEPKNLNFED